MQFIPTTPPRTFEAGFEYKRTISDCGRIYLETDEQVTFITENASEYDVVRKEWGFYATPSTNGRLASFGLKACLVRNRDKRLYILLVEDGKEALFNEYLKQEQAEVLLWLDGQDAVNAFVDGGGSAVGA